MVEQCLHKALAAGPIPAAGTMTLLSKCPFCDEDDGSFFIPGKIVEEFRTSPGHPEKGARSVTLQEFSCLTCHRKGKAMVQLGDEPQRDISPN